MESSGRPLKLNEQKQKDLLAFLALGCSRRVAAKYVGCSPSTIRRLTLRDEDFGWRLKLAKSRQEVTQLGNIHAAGKDNWRAAAWLLERINPERYGPRRSGTVTPEQISQLMSDFAQVLVEFLEFRGSFRDFVFENLVLTA